MNTAAFRRKPGKDWENIEKPLVARNVMNNTSD